MNVKDYRRFFASVFRTEIPATGPLKIDTRKIFEIRRRQRLTNTSRHSSLMTTFTKHSCKACLRATQKTLFYRLRKFFNQVRQSFFGQTYITYEQDLQTYCILSIFQVLKYNSESWSDVPLWGAGSQCWGPLTWAQLSPSPGTRL